MILLLLAAVLFLIFAAVFIGRIINAWRYKVRSPAGVQKAGFVKIGGIEQYVQVRGQNASNPVVVVLHGGPGSPMASWSYVWQGELERTYTIVHWDQRGCGNTYYRDPNAARPTLELLLSDLDELVDHIRATYNKDKVTLLGHSWGTFLGGFYAARHPEKVSVWVPVSQMVDFKGSEAASTQEAVRLAREAGRDRDVELLEKGLAELMALDDFGGTEAKALLRLRQRKEKYLPLQYGGGMTRLRLFSPYLTFSDLKWMVAFNALIDQNRLLYRPLLSDTAPLPTRSEVPVLMFAGTEDWTTPYSVARSYFQNISAPQKRFFSIENAGHIPFLDQQQVFSRALEDALKDLAQS